MLGCTQDVMGSNEHGTGFGAQEKFLQTENVSETAE